MKRIIFNIRKMEEKKDNNMCMRLRELNGLSSSELLKKTSQYDAIPVDIAQVCFDLDVRLKPFDFHEIEERISKEDGLESGNEILGAVIAYKDELAILYRQSDTTNRKRFTIAHELAHCCLHMRPDTTSPYIEFRRDEKSNKDKEVKANIFAGQLLIPEKSLRKLIGGSSFLASNLIPSLAGLFMVSENVMKARLSELKIKII